MLKTTRLLRPLILVCLAFSFITLPVQAAETKTRTLFTGADFQGANGIRVSPDGLLYVTSAVGSRIDVLDPSSGKRLLSLGQEQGVFGPDDLAFSPNGQLYWTAFFTGQVMRLNTDGQAELVAQVGPGVNAISFSDTGRLFVSRVFLADEVYEIDPEGIQAPRLIQQGIGGLNAMDISADGYLYGPLWFKGQIVRIDVDSGALTVIADGLDTPAAVKFSPEGELHALDQHQGTLLRINIENGDKHIVAYPGLGADNLDFDSKGRIYITNAHEGSVNQVLPNGKMKALSPGGLSMPAGITVNEEGELVVAAAQSLRNYDAQTGNELSVIHASIGDPTTVATPLTVSNYDEQLLVTSWFSNTVQIWDPENQTLRTSYSDFLVPLNAISFDDDIIVAELATHRVVRRKAGTMDSEVLLAGIPVPTGLAADDDQLFVADWLSGTIYQLIVDDLVLATPHPIITGLKQPEGMALDEEGRLLVLETGKQRLLRINPQDPNIEVLADELAIGLRGVPGYPPSWLLSSVVVDACGRITVTQDLNNSLLRVVPDEVVSGKCREDYQDDDSSVIVRKQ
jgi:sugar lactone lactonase YvrE